MATEPDHEPDFSVGSRSNLGFQTSLLCRAEKAEGQLADIRQIVTTDHETKADFIARVNAILNR